MIRKLGRSIKKHAGKIAAAGVGLALSANTVAAQSILDASTTNVVGEVSTLFGYIKPVTMGIVGFGIVVSLVKLLKRK